MPSTPPAPLPAERPARRREVRTALSITLQLTRALPALLRLVRAGHEGDAAVIRSASREIATDILRASRDRSRDPHSRPLLYLQATLDVLSRPRLRTRSRAA